MWQWWFQISSFFQSLNLRFLLFIFGFCTFSFFVNNVQGGRRNQNIEISVRTEVDNYSLSSNLDTALILNRSDIVIFWKLQNDSLKARCRLVGLSEEWSKLENQYVSIYYDLSGNSYVYEIEISNGSLIEIPIEIVVRWWANDRFKQFLFVIIGVIIVLSAFFYFIRNIKVFKKKVEKEYEC